MLKEGGTREKGNMVRLSKLIILLIILLASTDGSAADTPSVAGTWDWVGGQVLVVLPDQTQKVWWDGNQVNQGTWQILNPATRQYQFKYDNGGWVDTVTLSADGNTLTGTNQQGTSLRGTRRN